MRAFRRVVARARTAEQREALLASIRDEFSDYRRVFRGRVPNSSSKRLFESRLLEFIRVPRRGPDSISPVDYSQELASRDLVHLRSARAVRVWRAYLKHPMRAVRGEGAEYSAWCGHDTLIPMVKRLIGHADPVIVKHAARGAGLAANHKYASDAYQSAAFNALLPIVRGERKNGRAADWEKAAFDAADSLLQIDRPEAINELRSVRCIHAKNRCIRAVLLKLNQSRDDGHRLTSVRADAAILWPVYEAVRAERLLAADRSTKDQVLGEILKLTADGDPERTLAEARSAIREAGSEWSLLPEAARQAIRRCAKVPEPDAALGLLTRQPRRFGTDAAQILRAYELASHITTDGFPLYFYNHGEHVRECLAGLRLLKLDRQVQLFEDALKLFPRRLSGRSAWQKAFDALDDRRSKSLGKIGDQFERGVGAVYKAVERAMSARPEAFRAAFK